jgi:hypothetical protein
VRIGRSSGSPGLVRQLRKGGKGQLGSEDVKWRWDEGPSENSWRLAGLYDAGSEL